MPWSAVANIAGSVLGDAVSSGINYAANSALQRDAQKHQIELMQNAKQWQVEDLRKAGLNPILATGLNTSAPGSPLSSYSGASNSALREAMASLRKKESQVADEQIATAKSVQDVNSAQAEKTRAEAEKVRRETTQIPTLSQAEISSIEHRKHSTYFGALVNDVAGLISRIGSSEMSRVEKQAEELLRRRFEASGVPALQRPTDFEIQQMAKKIAEKTAKKTTDKGGVRHPTGRSVLY